MRPVRRRRVRDFLLRGADEERPRERFSAIAAWSAIGSSLQTGPGRAADRADLTTSLSYALAAVAGGIAELCNQGVLEASSLATRPFQADGCRLERPTTWDLTRPDHITVGTVGTVRTVGTGEGAGDTGRTQEGTQETRPSPGLTLM